MSEENEEEYDEEYLGRKLALTKIFDRVCSRFKYEHESLAEKIAPIVAKKSDGLLSLRYFYFDYPEELKERIPVTLYIRVADNERNPYNVHTGYVVVVGKDDIFKKAEELGISKEVVKYVFKDEDIRSPAIRGCLISLAAFEKIKYDPKMIGDLFKVVATKSEELKDLVKERAKKKLEEVS